MKVLHLTDPQGVAGKIELHPQITLLRDLDPARRRWLVEQMGRLGSEGGIGATGEIEAHGIRFDLDDAALSLLGLEVTSSDVVVTAAELPGHDASLAEAVGARAAASRRRELLLDRLASRREDLVAVVAERDGHVGEQDELRRGEGRARDARAAAEVEAAGLDAELAEARVGCEKAEGQVTELTSAREEAGAERSRRRATVDASQNRRRVAVAAATQAAAALEEARSGLDQAGDVAARAESARDRLVAAEKAATEADPDHDRSPLSGHLTALERRRVELTRLETALGEAGTEQVAAALETLTAASSEGAPVVAALALADSWRDLHQQISALEAGVSKEEREAEHRVAQARQIVVEAETEFNQPILTPEQISKVEAARNAVLECQDRAEGRFGSGRARRRLEDLRADERRVLERLGFSTYADYMMSASARGMGSTNRGALDAARANLAAANEDLAVLAGASDRVRRRTELLQRRDAVAPRVADLLGHEPTGPEAEEELRSLRAAVAPDETALEALADTLIGAGVDVGPGPHERADVVLLAKAYVAEGHDAETERGQIEEAVAALDMAIGEMRAARDRGAVDVPTDLVLPELAEPPAPSDAADDHAADDHAARTLREARWAEVEAARAASVEAAAALARQKQGAAELSELEAALAEATRAESEAADELAEAERALADGVEVEVTDTADRLSQAERALAEAREVERGVTARIAGRQGRTGLEALEAEIAALVETSEAQVASAAIAEQDVADELSVAEAELSAATEAELAANAAVASVDRSSLVTDLEWALLARLAKVRAVGPGGSAPVVLDDPFAALHDDEIGLVLDRLAHTARAVQVVVLSERDAVAAWASASGPDRVAVLDGA